MTTRTEAQRLMLDYRQLPVQAFFANPGAGTADDGIDLLDLLRTLSRGKWWLLLFTVAGVVLGAYYALGVAVPLYTSKAVVALTEREEQVMDLESAMGGLSVDEATVNTKAEVIRSRQLLSRVVRDLELVEDPEFNPALAPVAPLSIGWITQIVFGPPPEPSEQEAFDATADRLLEALSVSNMPESYVFEIEAETNSPHKSAEIANTLAELYIRDQLQLKFEATEKATSWLGKRVSELKAELQAAEKKLKDFTASSQLVNSESLAGLGRQLKDLRDRLAEKRLAADAVTARLSALEDAFGSASPSEIAALADDAVLHRLAERLQAGTGSREALDARVEQVVDLARAEQRRERRQIDVLEESVADLEERIERQSRELVTQQQLERDVEASALVYESVLSRLKELSVQQGLQEPDARVLSQAVVRKDASAPQAGLVMALSGLLGFFAGSGFLVLREMRQKVFRTAEELESYTGMPVIGQIPQAPVARRQKLLMHIASKPTSAFSEAVRNLRTSILLSDMDSPPKVIVLTSSVPGEGKTTQSLGLAQNLALMGKKVLLIEADIRRRTFSEYFDVSEDEPGLVSAVAGGAPLSEIVFRSEKLGMDILLGEKSSVNAADFFSSRSFAEFAEAAKDAYDIIILDTPPVLAVPDARVVGQLADAIIYVVHWDKTAKAQVSSGLRTLQSLKLPVTGLVLSQIDPKGMKRYGHDSYGTYGSGYYDA